MITLTHREAQRVQVLNTLERGELLMAEASSLLGLSVRQVRRLRSDYRARGAIALVHGNRGQSSPRRTPDPIRERVIALAQTTYAGANHRHLTELLTEREGLTLSLPTVRRILLDAGLRSPRRRRPPRHRTRRERMPQSGLVVLLDGSTHAWLQDRGPRVTLLAAVDDATGHVLSAVVRDQEDAHGYLWLLRDLVTHHGLPVAVYTDRHSVFEHTPRALTLDEQLRGCPQPTQVGRALQDVGIAWIPARSPQAKDRAAYYSSFRVCGAH